MRRRVRLAFMAGGQMARREVIEVVCDRCSRTETQAPGSTPKTDGVEASFEFHGEKVVYEDLCRRCRDTLTNYFAKVTKAKQDDEGEKPTPITAGDPPPVVKKGLFGKTNAAG